MKNFLEHLGQYLNISIMGLRKLLPVRRGLFVAFAIGLTLLYCAARSDHPLAVDFYAVLMFENADRIVRLFVLYLAVRVLTGNKVRTHRLWNKVGKDVTNPLIVAWCATWIIAAALVISSVK